MNDPTEWWRERDEEILRGEVQKLLDMPRPAYVQRRMHEHVYEPIPMPVAAPKREHRWAREIGAWIVIVATVALVWIVATWAYGETPAPPCRGSGCEDFTVTPSTYGPPGPNGGPAPWTR